MITQTNQFFRVAFLTFFFAFPLIVFTQTSNSEIDSFDELPVVEQIAYLKAVLSEYENGLPPCHTAECLDRKADLMDSFQGQGRGLLSLLDTYFDLPYLLNRQIKMDFKTRSCPMLEFAESFGSISGSDKVFCYVGFLARWMQQKIMMNKDLLKNAPSKASQGAIRKKLGTLWQRVSGNATAAHDLVLEHYSLHFDWDNAAQLSIHKLGIAFKQLTDELLTRIESGEINPEGYSYEPNNMLSGLSDFILQFGNLISTVRDFSKLDLGMPSVQALHDSLENILPQTEAKLKWFQRIDLVEDLFVLSLFYRAGQVALLPFSGSYGTLARVLNKCAPSALSMGGSYWFSSNPSVQYRHNGVPVLYLRQAERDEATIRNALVAYKRVINSLRERIDKLQEQAKGTTE